MTTKLIVFNVPSLKSALLIEESIVLWQISIEEVRGTERSLGYSKIVRELEKSRSVGTLLNMFRSGKKSLQDRNT